MALEKMDAAALPRVCSARHLLGRGGRAALRDGDANHHGVLLDTVCVRFDLVVDLGAHAAGDREGDEVSNEVDDVRRLACLLHKDGDDVEDARGELQAV